MVDSIVKSLAAEGEEPLCIRFANTVGERLSDQPDEYLSTTEALASWMKRAGLLAGDAMFDDAYRQRAIHLRDSIYRSFSAIAAGRSPGEADLEAVNDELCEALAKLELGVGLEWSLSESDLEERALMILTLSAASLMTSDLKDRVRECANSTCGWLFIDHSKNRSRRWCSMSDCGNRAKARRFQAKKKG